MVGQVLLTTAFLGCGWDAVRTKSLTGAMSRLFGGTSSSIDLDASCVLLDADKNIVDQVWFRQLKSYDGSIVHRGDNLTGDGDGDDLYVNKIGLGVKPSPMEFIFCLFFIRRRRNLADGPGKRLSKIRSADRR